jgi:sarcosine oxidase subunit alpha
MAPNATNDGDETAGPAGPGLSLAAAALQAGELTLARSFRLHRPRGAFCHRGWCQQCKVRLGDGRVVLACQTPARELEQWQRPSAHLRAIGFLAERFPPWFHEHRLLRPRALRQTYLNVLRRLSAALPISRAPGNAGAKAWTTRRCHTLVVGGGLSGLTAATELARAGRDVLLVEAQDLGGSANDIPVLSPDVDARRRAFRQSSALGLENTLCIGLYDEATSALCVTDTGAVAITFEELVVATGAYDRLLPVPGNDLPGVIGLRAFERLARLKAIPSGTRIGVYAASAEATRAHAAATAAGCNLAWLAGPDALPETAASDVHPHALLMRIVGRRRIGGVHLGGGQHLACDLLVLGFTQPTYEVQAQAGQHIRFHGVGAPFWTEGATHVPTLVVGEAAGATGPAAAAVDAETSVRGWLQARPFDRPVPAAGVCPIGALSDQAMLCPCEDVRVGDIRGAIADGFANVELVKRRTGAGTGPCQGKLCHHALLSCLAEAGIETALPTIRPLLRPVPLSTFAGGADD